MDEDKIKLLISNQVGEAKLAASEKRLQTITWLAGGLLTIFGIVLPLFLTFVSLTTSKERVDNAIVNMEKDFVRIREVEDKFALGMKGEFNHFTEDQRKDAHENSIFLERSVRKMQTDFKELAEAQFKKPDINCFHSGASLEGSTLILTPHDNLASIEIRNIGESPTESIHVKLYTKSNVPYGIYSDSPVDWERMEVNDEPYFNFAYRVVSSIQNIDPQESYGLSFIMNITDAKKEEIPMLLKVYYEQIEPKIYNFTIVLDGTK